VLYVTLSEVKANLNITTSANDDELTDMADAAEGAVLAMSGPVSLSATVTETVWPYNGVAVLSSAPVASIASVTTSGGTPVTYTANLGAGLLDVSTIWYPTRDLPLTVTYTPQPRTTAAQVRMAVLMVTARLWETQRGNTPAILQGGEQEVFTPGLQGILAEARGILGLGSRPPAVA